MQEIIIRISNETYQNVVKNGFIYDEDGEEISHAIINGTVLPKGYGRIIDYGYVVDAIDDWVNAEEYRYTNATDYLRRRIANVPTIIEGE